MSGTHYVYHFRDLSDDCEITGFHIYTEEQVSNFTRLEPVVFFKKLGDASKMNDLAFAMYNSMRIDIIGNYEMMYQSHHHTHVD